MRIEPGNPNFSPVPSRKPGRIVTRSVSSSATSSEASAETRESVELNSLMTGLVEIPDVRSELVEEVRKRLNNGEHLTRAAAEQTASAILADLADFIGQ